MKKLMLCTLLTVIFAVSDSVLQAQNLMLVPFKHNGKWGLVDDKSREVLAPTYNSLRLMDSFRYAEFDGKIMYNLMTGESINVQGPYKTSLYIEGYEYHLFSSNERSILTSFLGEKAIRPSGVYTNMELIYFVDFYGKPAGELIYGITNNHKIDLMRNNRRLRKFIPGEYDYDDIRLIKNKKGQNIGLLVRSEDVLTLYDHELKMIIRISNIPPYDKVSTLVSKGVVGNLSELYETDGIVLDYLYVMTVSESFGWDMSPAGINNRWSFGASNFYLERERNNYFIRNKTESKYEKPVQLNNYWLTEDLGYKTIEMNQGQSLFFYDRDMPTGGGIPFPSYYLLE